MGERIEWILENCRDDSGKEWNAKSLSLAAGLSAGHVGLLKRGTVTGPEPGTLEAIARTAKVSYRWLGTGEGLPSDPDIPGLEPRGSITGNTYGSLPLYPRLLATAKILAPDFEPWVWIEVGKAGILLPDVPVTAKTLVGVARIVMESVPPPEENAR